ncbi:hypothetical protein [Aureispira anguillae]|uniref:Uncharacterized protein n=1 Tax=Aureispira anguillae TaxID=2864201 RepID=A0A915YDX5_9BACT|nr:hypothetical protein [Aureispira anguillae]BDS11265.1 hypothetical protein AsAng_0019770 [Aureispira anguillae]
MIKKIGKRLLKALGIVIALLLVAFAVLYLVYNQPLPEGKQGAEAEALANKMLQAVNQEAWDSTNYVEWTFVGMHDFVWDKKRHLVKVSWKDYSVLLNPNTMKGKIYRDGQEQAEDPSILETAYSYFTNDAFWMNGYVQIRNGNPELRAVDLEDGTKGLLVTYPTGGVTPGDSYLWMLNEDGLPKAWRMWVGIIPIGGIEVSWENWKTLASGAKIAQNHNAGIADIAITNIKSYQTWQEGGWDEDIFAPILGD